MNMPGFTAGNSLCSDSRKCNTLSAAVVTSNSLIEPQLRVGGGGLGNKCGDDYGECYIDCSVRYPESKDSPNNLNSDFRQACFDSCDAAHDLCRGGRLAIGRARAVRIPFSSGLARASFT